MRKFRMPDLDITGTWVVAVGVFFHLIARLVRKQPEMAVEMGEGLGIAMMIFGGYPGCRAGRGGVGNCTSGRGSLLGYREAG